MSKRELLDTKGHVPDYLTNRVNKIYGSKFAYSQLSLRQVRRIIKIVYTHYGNIPSMIDFHVLIERIRFYQDLPF